MSGVFAVQQLEQVRSEIPTAPPPLSLSPDSLSALLVCGPPGPEDVLQHESIVDAPHRQARRGSVPVHIKLKEKEKKITRREALKSRE